MHELNLIYKSFIIIESSSAHADSGRTTKIYLNDFSDHMVLLYSFVRAYESRRY